MRAKRLPCRWYATVLHEGVEDVAWRCAPFHLSMMHQVETSFRESKSLLKEMVFQGRTGPR